MHIAGGHSMEVLNMVVEVRWVLAHILHPEWNGRINITIGIFWKSFQFNCVGTIK